MMIKPRVFWISVVAVLLLCAISSEYMYRFLSESVPVSANSAAARVPIMVYHDVKSKITNYTITPNEFESDLKFLQENHYTTVTINDLIDYVHSEKELPEKPIVLSFDDGYLSNYKYVFPLIQKYNAKIVFSIIAKNTDDFTRVPDDNIEYSHVTWSQLKEMVDSGLVEVQNHTYNLHSTQKKGRIGCKQMYGETDAHYAAALSEDLLKCQDEIRTNLGVTPNTFVYPYGEKSKNSDSILRSLGFQATLTCNYGVNLVARNPDALFDLKRICRTHGTSLEKALNAAFKTLK